MNANDRQEVREILAESLERIGSGYGAHLDIRAEAAHLRQLQLAEPEKPAPNPLILASSDGRFQMQVWVKPRRLEAQILEQPEEWRRTGADSEGYPGKWLDCGRGREVWSYNYPSFSYKSHITLFLRGAGKAMDSQIFARDFDFDSARDEYLAKLEAAVAAMPKVEPKAKWKVGLVEALVEEAYREGVHDADLYDKETTTLSLTAMWHQSRAKRAVERGPSGPGGKR